MGWHPRGQGFYAPLVHLTGTFKNCLCPRVFRPTLASRAWREPCKGLSNRFSKLPHATPIRAGCRVMPVATTMWPTPFSSATDLAGSSEGDVFHNGREFPYLDINGPAEQCSSSQFDQLDAHCSNQAFVPWLHITQPLWIEAPHHQASLVISLALPPHLYP